MKKLHARWGDAVEFIDVVVRQAHPGPGAAPYRSFEDKQRDAERYQRDEQIPWTVLVDDLPGTVHQAYGGVADPTYLIDADGRVAFYNIWTFAPSLDEALAQLFQQGGNGVVHGGVEQMPHLGPALTDGWRGLERGLPQSYLDLEMAAPGSATAVFLGSRLKPLLEPVTLRAESLPANLKLGLCLGALAASVGVGYLLMKRRS